MNSNKRQSNTLLALKNLETKLAPTETPSTKCGIE